MLDYAANLLLHLPASRMRELFAERCAEDGLDPDSEIDAHTEGALDTETFWERVQQSMEERRLRLVFVADAISTELQRIIEFLGPQMSRTRLLAIEVRQYVGPQGQPRTLVPRIIGQTIASVDAMQAARAMVRPWDEASFFEALAASGIDPTFTRQLLESSRAHGLDISWGTGATYGTLRIKLAIGERLAPLTGIDTTGKMLWEPRALEPFPPFDAETHRAEVVRRLNATPGIALPEKIAAGAWAHIRTFELDPAVYQSILGVIEWIADELRTHSPGETGHASPGTSDEPEGGE